jgi:threonine/homoserine/homoserine lactone efflux protein
MALIPIDLLAGFFAAAILLALAPGPDNLFVLTQAALYGRASGLAVMFGLCTGLIGHSVAVALGIAVIFQTSATAFTAVKFAGTAYLLYLAWQAFRTTATGPAAVSRERLGRLYRRGIIMNLTNPKVALFFLAFLPQFADPLRGSLPLQLLLLGATFIAATVLVFGAIALLAGTLGGWLKRSPLVQRGLNWAAGAVFIGLAVSLLLAKR